MKCERFIEPKFSSPDRLHDKKYEGNTCYVRARKEKKIIDVFRYTNPGYLQNWKLQMEKLYQV